MLREVMRRTHGPAAVFFYWIAELARLEHKKRFGATQLVIIDKNKMRKRSSNLENMKIPQTITNESILLEYRLDFGRKF